MEVMLEEQRQVSTQRTPSGQVTTERVSTSSVSAANKGAFQFYNVVYYIVGLLEVILVIRLALKILGANPSSGFVSFMYSLTDPFVAPFAGIFNTAVANKDQIVSVLEPSVLIAMVVYALVGWGLARLIAVTMSGRD
jgi:uncharacterized protein YggT (Ycf19 family)